MISEYISTGRNRFYCTYVTWKYIFLHLKTRLNPKFETCISNLKILHNTFSPTPTQQPIYLLVLGVTGRLHAKTHTQIRTWWPFVSQIFQKLSIMTRTSTCFFRPDRPEHPSIRFLLLKHINTRQPRLKIKVDALGTPPRLKQEQSTCGESLLCATHRHFVFWMHPRLQIWDRQRI